MQKKKNILLATSFVMLTLASVVVYWLGHKEASSGVDKNLFKVDDFKTIDRIVMASSAQKVELKYIDNRWRVNDRHEADRQLVDVLFATLQQAVPKRPVAEKLRDSLNLALEQKGVLISLYEGQTLKQEFYAGGNENRTQAYFKEKGGTTPYVMVIPGYRVYVSGILELNENGWRDKYIFAFNWQNFKKLEARFPDPKNNFSVVMQDRRPALEGMPKADTARVNTFLDNVSLLTADEFVKIDSTAQIPAMTIAVEDIAGRTYSLEIFEKGPAVPQFTGRVQGAEYALFDRRKVEQVLKSRQYFQPK